ncbi:MAG: clostripain-related cysteine peptidase [Defluviitaleaceae bacterium]|nr:clostripain-related cysteine peptidase [Defluviitaleaceae bacterium]
MKTTKHFFIYLSTFVLIVGLLAVSFYVSKNEEYEQVALTKFSRDVKNISFEELEFEVWDIQKATNFVTKRELKPYTIMIYLNGSDLESEDGLATDDIIEMLESGVNGANLNLVLLTGGANRWQNDVIPENECVLWEVIDGKLIKIAGIGLHNMGNAGTLSSFIEFSKENFPAEKYGLIMWDHGGGSIAGYGDDENFIKGNLTLLDMNLAFEHANLSENKLEFLGFDACLMQTIEMAVVSADYAKFLIASEDLEPGDGWDYHFLEVLNKNPNMGGDELGKHIVDYFIDFYNGRKGEILTLSVVDLQYANDVMAAMGALMDKCNQDLLETPAKHFASFSRRRSNTKTFGEGSPRDNEADMVDIGDMAEMLSDLYPSEAKAVKNALKQAVAYNRHNSKTNLSGLSTYYIYGGKEIGEYSLKTYESLDMSQEYTKYLNKFYNILTEKRRTRSSGDILKRELTVWKQDSENKFVMQGISNEIRLIETKWPQINGKNVCMYKINNKEDIDLYAIPSKLNGKNGDIVVMISEEFKDGKILGMRYDDGLIIQKGYSEIEIGDKLAFYYQVKELDKLDFELGEEFTITEKLSLEWIKIDQNAYFYSFMVTDLNQNVYFEAFTKNHPRLFAKVVFHTITQLEPHYLVQMV